MTLSPTDSKIDAHNKHGQRIRESSKTPELPANQAPIPNQVRLNNLINAQLLTVDRQVAVRNEINSS